MAEKKPLGYATIHLRLRKEFGPAREHLCACGAEAAHWAYNHLDPDELLAPCAIKGRIRPYSLDLTNYLPMCRSCHRKFDMRIERASDQYKRRAAEALMFLHLNPEIAA